MKTVMPENGVGASHVHHTLTALPYKIGLRRISRKYYPPKYTPFEPCCPPFGHGMDRSTNGHFWKDYAGAAFNDKGGLQTFAASARALGQSGESGRSMRGQIHKCCKRSNGGSEPRL
jgi:hypothetical protein